jgi:hypothetical protein
MDALAQLALMTKAKLLFETSDTFLSFPALTPIPYSSDEMNFTNPATPQQLHAFADFSTWTNSLPQGTLFQPSQSDMLWDVYQDVLNSPQVEIAQGSLTAAQTAALQAAQAVLSTQGPNGVLVDTPALVAYQQYQQAYFVANQDYNNQEITASASADPKVQTAWQNGGQTAAQAAVTAAESDWETKGFKAQVEEAQATVHTLGSQSPHVKWESWQALCNPDTDFLTDPTDGQFGPTVFAPCDVINQPVWPSFSIAGADIPNLVSQAPPELKNIFGTTSGESTIDSMSFEYCRAAVIRPWFCPDIFTARFWRFTDPTVQLSDGNNPPSGNWPAYITAVVFARNIAVTMRPASPASPLPPPVHAFSPLPAAIIKAAPAPVIRPLPPLFLRTAALHDRPIPTSPAGAPASSPVRAIAPSSAGRVMTLEPRLAGPAVATTPVAAKPVVLSPILRMRLAAATFPSNSAPATATTTTRTSPSEISVLAFIYQRLPKCPNPDPTLSWT